MSYQVPMRLIGLAVVLTLGLILAPLASKAQVTKVWRVGYLTSAYEVGNPRMVAFRPRLRELGYVEGQNVELDIRSAEGTPERLPGLAAALVDLKVDVIVAGGSPSIAAAKKATTSIPIVMVLGSDPVAGGFVASLARPGGNITGVTLQNTEVAGKRLQLLKEAVPNLSRVAFLWEPGFQPARRSLGETQAAAPVLGLQLQAMEVRSPGELDGVVAAVTRNRAGAGVGGGPIAFSRRLEIGRLAIKHRLAIVGPSHEYAEAGWLMAFGPSYTDQSRHAADFVDRILKGAKPADLPVEQPTCLS